MPADAPADESFVSAISNYIREMAGFARARALYGNTKSKAFLVQAGPVADKLYRSSRTRERFLSPFFPRSPVSFGGHGNAAPVYTSGAPGRGFLRLLNFCFRHQTFMRHRMIRREREKNLPRNYPRVGVTAVGCGRS